MTNIQLYDKLWHNLYGDVTVIKEKRKIMGYTQEKMANLLEISLRQYIRIDQENCLPRTDILKKLIDLLQLSDQELGEYIKVIINKKAS